MQGEGIGRAIGLKIVPGQRQSRHGRETAPQAFEAGFTTTLDSIEIPSTSRCVAHRWWCVVNSFVPGENQSVCSLKYSPGS